MQQMGLVKTILTDWYNIYFFFGKQLPTATIFQLFYHTPGETPRRNPATRISIFVIAAVFFDDSFQTDQYHSQ